jgi:hypothetical protein
VLQFYAAEAVTWRQWISASTGSGSAYAAGGGESACYRDQTISAVFSLPRTWDARAHQEQTPGGTLIAGDVIASTFQALGDQDQVIWRDVSYGVEGESIPVRIGGRLWYRTVLRRGE